jgi:hypothetical protein
MDKNHRPQHCWGTLSWDPSQLWELYCLLLFYLNKLSSFTHSNPWFSFFGFMRQEPRSSTLLLAKHLSQQNWVLHKSPITVLGFLIQGLALDRQVLYHLSCSHSHFALVIFGIESQSFAHHILFTFPTFCENQLNWVFSVIKLAQLVETRLLISGSWIWPSVPHLPITLWNMSVIVSMLANFSSCLCAWWHIAWLKVSAFKQRIVTGCPKTQTASLRLIIVWRNLSSKVPLAHGLVIYLVLAF